MLPVTVRRVLLAEHRVDFRKGFNGLLGEAFRVGAQPYDGDCIIFVKNDRTQIRALIGDRYGLYLVLRRFEGGRLRALLAFAEHPSTKTISTGELSLLLEGSSFTVHARAKAWRSNGNERQQSQDTALSLDTRSST
ncbi:MAG TPA: IS66 family insertion sequence element accessory protein TnpB [Polyangiaceae bacterium]|nr:IS66 family insertion sequence element accessory protein TnpB [Polyangiaceae bacterium]